MDKYSAIQALFENERNEENAIAMARYMKDNFRFYGIAAPARKELYKGFIRSEKAAKMIDWGFLEQCCEDEHREFQYLIYDYLLALEKYAVFEDIGRIRHFIVTKPWWDTTDFLCKVIGDIGTRDKRVAELMLEWAVDENIWIRRSAILHQLAYKDKTDTKLLESIICSCLGTDEFFINKAIGWTLREYSKTDPGWVKGFLSRYSDRLNSLSIKEASKYII